MAAAGGVSFILNLQTMSSLSYQHIPAFMPESVTEQTRLTFYKCLRWQAEETLDPLNCPYHYFCDSTYPGNYPPFVDVLVFLFTASSYLVTLVIVVIDISKRWPASSIRFKRHFLPSGPASLSVFLLSLAKGYRINTLFPLSCVGPAILQLLQVSAFLFDIGDEKGVRYAFLEASTISGILHASLYLDTILLPYYTGYDALVSSTFSGQCPSCVCRKQPMVVGGSLVMYRGWSVTTFLVVGALCFRMLGRTSEDCRRKTASVKSLLESLGWIAIIIDCIYLIRNAPPEQTTTRVAAFGGVLLLICLHLMKRVSARILQWHKSPQEKQDC